jgi:iron complex transport system ATP-binding protein
MLQVTGLTAGYGDRVVLDGVDLGVTRGELLAVVGPNGCGKTTLLRAISGVLPIGAGSILIGDVSVATMRPPQMARRVAVVAQAAALPEGFSAFEVALMGRAPHLRLLQSEGSRDRAIVRAAMERTGCWDLRSRPVEELSGGERQRVVIARALAQEPELLLLDEPTSHLDVRHQVAAFRLVRELCAERGLAAVAVVHDLTLAAMFADRVALMSRGRVVGCGTPEAVLDAPAIERVYGLAVRVIAHPATGRPIIVPDALEDAAHADLAAEVMR